MVPMAATAAALTLSTETIGSMAIAVVSDTAVASPVLTELSEAMEADVAAMVATEADVEATEATEATGATATISGSGDQELDLATVALAAEVMVVSATVVLAVAAEVMVVSEATVADRTARSTGE